MKVKAFRFPLLIHAVVMLLATSVHAVPPTLQSDLNDQDQQTLEALVKIAQQHSAAIKEAKAELGVSSLGDSVIVEITPSYSVGTFLEEGERFPSNSQDLSVALIFNPLAMVSALQQRPALRTQLQEATRQKRAEVVQAYVAYLQAKQTQAIAQYRMQDHQNKTADDASLTATSELFTANSNVRVALENLAAVVGRSPSDLLALLGHVLNLLNWKIMI